MKQFITVSVTLPIQGSKERTTEQVVIPTANILQISKQYISYIVGTRIIEHDLAEGEFEWLRGLLC